MSTSTNTAMHVCFQIGFLYKTNNNYNIQCTMYSECQNELLMRNRKFIIIAISLTNHLQCESCAYLIKVKQGETRCIDVVYFSQFVKTFQKRFICTLSSLLDTFFGKLYKHIQQIDIYYTW